MASNLHCNHRNGREEQTSPEGPNLTDVADSTPQHGRTTGTHICEEYQDIFHLEGKPLTCTTAVKHKISTRTDTGQCTTISPPRQTQGRGEYAEKKEMLKNGIIKPSTSQWNALLLVVPKKADSIGKPRLRIVIDFRKLNDLTIGDLFPLSNIEEILDQLGKVKYDSRR